MIELNKSLKAFNSFGFDQCAERYATATTEQALEELVSIAKAKQWPVFILGGGSNIVLTQDIPGLVIHMTDTSVSVLSKDALGNQRIRAGAGVGWHDFVLQTLSMGAHGLENLSLIPGNVGAAPVQNIGAYGIEVKDRIYKVRALHLPTQTWKEFTAVECEFSYRHSYFKNFPGEYAISCVEFDLGSQCNIADGYASLKQELSARGLASPTAKQISDAVISIRQSRLPDPANIGNAGSFFHNPIVPDAQVSELEGTFPGVVSYPAHNGFRKLSAAWLIDQAGFKGMRKGGVGVYNRQALVLVNLGGGCGEQIVDLAGDIQRKVMRLYGVELSIEPVIL
jgi:UDP-N-acetylmuramate dehydrogenase